MAAASAASATPINTQACAEPIVHKVALRCKVVATEDDAINEAIAHVTAVLADGRRVHVFVEHAKGSLQRPMTTGQLDAKFHGMADAVIGVARCNALIATCWGVGQATELRMLAARAQARLLAAPVDIHRHPPGFTVTHSARWLVHRASRCLMETAEVHPFEPTSLPRRAAPGNASWPDLDHAVYKITTKFLMNTE